MQLSVIIVNYNVKHFLEQCLCSVQKACSGLAAEVIVVDNNSTDNSLEYLTSRFESVQFIPNKENHGFAKACNQGWQKAKGDYVLFLNPDTIVPEDCFNKCISFFQSHPDAGGLGVKMLDGSGKFLKESKRAFPSPLTSLYKLFGLAKLFPRSGTFARYHLGHLDENKNNEVDVLAGAFMMIRREVLDKVGSFDETFFMYGEDIDLSYRIQQAGYKNYYFAGTSIIHFKGESTRKGSMNYVRMFYKAMSVFVKKHYGGSRAGIFNFLIQTAILFRALLTATGTFIRRAGLPLIDAGLILLSFWLMKNVWNEYVRTDIRYENKLLWIAFPAFTIFYLISAYYAGLYDRWYKRSELASATLIATLVLLAAYALLPEHYRFSRGIILFGALLAFAMISLLRWMLIKTEVLKSDKEKPDRYTTVIAGTAEEYHQTTELLRDAGVQQRVLGRVDPAEGDIHSLGTVNRLAQLNATVPFHEVIFCEGALSFNAIIKYIQHLPPGVVAKIHAAGSHSIIGSSSSNTAGEILSKENGYKLDYPYNRRLKRLIDAGVSILALITFPVHLFLVRKPVSFFINCFKVLFAQKTWVGYAIPDKNLPSLRKAVLASNGISATTVQALPNESLQLMDYWYARDYEPSADLKIIRKMYRHLGG
jgi:GT2 family glycosyltransferase